MRRNHVRTHHVRVRRRRGDPAIARGWAGAPAGRSARPRRTLVVYASRFGSTKGVADRIARVLRANGLRVDVRPCELEPDPRGYAAVVLGSAVFNQRWLPAAERFAHDNRNALAGRPVWLFSVGTFGDRKPLIGPVMKHEPRNIAALKEAIHPQDYRVFAGAIDRHRWPLKSRLYYHALGGRLGDNRNWPAIEAWAHQIAYALEHRIGRP